MAEGWAKHLHGDQHEFESAGLVAHGQNPNAIAVMREAGIDITTQQSTALDDLPNLDFDIVYTVCGHADETCPLFPGKTKKIHVGFDDPPKLAADATTEEEKLMHYRRVRDEIQTWIANLDLVA